MEAALDRDVERASSSLGALTVTVATDAETRAISARPTDAVHDAIAAEFGRPVEHIEEALLGDDAVQPGESFQQFGIEVITATLCCCLSPHPDPRHSVHVLLPNLVRVVCRTGRGWCVALSVRMVRRTGREGGVALGEGGVSQPPPHRGVLLPVAPP